MENLSPTVVKKIFILKIKIAFMRIGKSERMFLGFGILLIGVFVLLQFGLNFLDFKTYIAIFLLLFGGYAIIKE